MPGTHTNTQTSTVFFGSFFLGFHYWAPSESVRITLISLEFSLLFRWWPLGFTTEHQNLFVWTLGFTTEHQNLCGSSEDVWITLISLEFFLWIRGVCMWVWVWVCVRVCMCVCVCVCVRFDQAFWASGDASTQKHVVALVFSLLIWWLDLAWWIWVSSCMLYCYLVSLF